MRGAAEVALALPICQNVVTITQFYIFLTLPIFSIPMPVFLAAGIGMELGTISTRKRLHKVLWMVLRLTLFSAVTIVIG